MLDFLRQFDGSKRNPRPVQIQVLKWLSESWDKANVFALQCPTGTGKSAIAKAIQNATGGHIMTLSNQLLNQYSEIYPDASVLKGGSHYECKENEHLSCADMKALGRSPCQGCPYRAARAGVCKPIPTLVNPASYYYATIHPKFVVPDVLVIDEAHQLYDSALMFVDSNLSVDDYGIGSTVTTLSDFVTWAKGAAKRMGEEADRWFKAGNFEKAQAIASRRSRLEDLSEGVAAEPENYLIYRESRPWRGRMREYLCVRPIKAPAVMLKQLTQAKKVVLMSATLFRSDVEKVFPGRRYEYLDVPNPIPKEQRPVYLSPVAERVNKDLEPKAVAEWIKGWRRRWPDKNTIVHVSYGWSDKLRPFFSSDEALFNTKENKGETIEAFKKQGGLLVAAGCAEGVDLPDDTCRLNLVPILPRENLGDPAVKKRLNLPGGERAYDLEVLKTTIQQFGRSTRSLTDSSICICGDPMFSRLAVKYRADLPQGFFDSIQFGRRPP